MTADSAAAAVSIPKRDVRLHYLGGTVLPKNGHQWLTIPARTESYGKRAAEVAGGYSGQL